MEIYNHDSPESITHKNNFTELENWINHLNYIEKEITNLVNLGEASFSVKSKEHPVLEKFKAQREENASKLKELNKYKDGLPRVLECEDMECDMFFITEHENFRKLYMKHLENYRRVKEEYFANLLK